MQLGQLQVILLTLIILVKIKRVISVQSWLQQPEYVEVGLSKSFESEEEQNRIFLINFLQYPINSCWKINFLTFGRASNKVDP